MAEQLLELEGGLAIWRVHVDEAREQDTNARSMRKQMFAQLQKTISKDRRLESLPLCALRGNHQIEIISGHHRFRAARAAGVTHIYVLMDITGLTDDQVRAKQLAHNAIEGEDDPQLIKAIYAEIQNVDLRLESFIDPGALDLKLVKVNIDDMRTTLDWRTALIAFMPYEEEKFEQACIAVESSLDRQSKVYLNDIRWMERWKAILARTGKEYDIHAAGTVFARIGDIVLEHLGDEPKNPTEWVPIRDMLGNAYMPKEAAVVLQAAIDRMLALGIVGQRNRWQVLEFLAAEYLGGPSEPAA